MQNNVLVLVWSFGTGFDKSVEYSLNDEAPNITSTLRSQTMFNISFTLRTVALAIALFTALSTTQILAQLPDPGMVIDPERTALLITDPQNDFLSPNGVTWGVVGKNVTANNTVENIEALFKTAKETGMPSLTCVS
jgi:hypothetical protein